MAPATVAPKRPAYSMIRVLLYPPNRAGTKLSPAAACFGAMQASAMATAPHVIATLFMPPPKSPRNIPINISMESCDIAAEKGQWMQGRLHLSLHRAASRAIFIWPWPGDELGLRRFCAIAASVNSNWAPRGRRRRKRPSLRDTLQMGKQHLNAL